MTTFEPDLFELYRPLEAAIFFGLSLIALVLLAVRPTTQRLLLLTIGSWNFVVLVAWNAFPPFDTDPPNLLLHTMLACVAFRFTRTTGLVGFIAVLICSVLFIFKPCVGCHRGSSELWRCRSNLRTIADAAEIYSTDNVGLYPRTLAQLTPRYLEEIPRCPSANGDTYSFTYRSATRPDAFTFFCYGDHSRSATPNGYPRYSSYQGDMGRPLKPTP